ncbi:MAG: class I SAM-dependent methyltransferase [Melioribacteraceae bacterium]
MVQDNQSILNYWDKYDIESMYDKNLLNAEIQIIKSQLQPNTKILDAGCGEGEATLAYSNVSGTTIHAADFSDVRLKKAGDRLRGSNNVLLKKVDFLGEYDLNHDYDFVISQRFLINLMEWRLQSKVLLDFMSMLKPDGKLILLEGSQNGVEELNNFRSIWGLEPIKVKWHNLFLDDGVLISFMQQNGFKLTDQKGLGSYFLLTRGIKPNLDKELKWNCEFNRIAATDKIEETLNMGIKFSRLKLWVFKKKGIDKTKSIDNL